MMTIVVGIIAFYIGVKKGRKDFKREIEFSEFNEWRKAMRKQAKIND